MANLYKIRRYVYFYTIKFREMKSTRALCIALTIFLLACKDNSSNTGKGKDEYETTKESLEQVEQKNPARFLEIQIKDKKNIIGQTVVQGVISNNAKVVTFKDINLKFSYYSKTGTMLQQDRTVIYDSVAPGKSIKFKTKEFAAKGTDSVAVEILGARY